MTNYVGLDVHKDSCHATVMDEDGRILKQAGFPNLPESIDTFFNDVDIDDAEVALEATYAWLPVYEQLEEMGIEAKLAHPYKTRIIAEEKIKTDRKDSEALAHLLRSKLLPESYVAPKEIRRLRDKLRRRVYFVENRKKYKAKIRAELVRRRIELQGSPWTKHWVRQLERLGIDAIDDYLTMIRALSLRIARIDNEIKEEAQKSREASLLMTIPGVSHFSAMVITTSIGDISRFSGPKELCSYAGLVPSSKRSGSTHIEGPITRQGDRYLRWVLIECSWSHVIHYDTRLSRFYHRIVKKKGSKKAITATARKLLVIIYWMIVRGEEYRPEG